MIVNILAAVSKNGVIGNEGKIPWHSPEDFAHFKETTSGPDKILVMGRRTYLSLPFSKSDPHTKLPGRSIRVVTSDDSGRGFNRSSNSQRNMVFGPMLTIHNFVKYYEQNIKDVIICGGAKIYSDLYPFANQMTITRIPEVVKGDTFFPFFDIQDWIRNRSQVLSNGVLIDYWIRREGTSKLADICAKL